MSTFIIFTDNLVNAQRENKEKNKKLLDFFREIADNKLVPVFLPEDSEGFFERMESAVIQLEYPTIINVGDLMKGGKISLSLLSAMIKIRKVELKKGVVLASSEEVLQTFGEGFHLFLLDENKTPGHNGQYQVINNLSEVLPLLSQVGNF